jgi:hypothetical protein
MDNQKSAQRIACTVLVAAALGWPAFAQQPIYKAPTAADWGALAKLPDFSGVWERGGGGGRGAVAAPAGGRANAPSPGAAPGAGARGRGGPSFTPQSDALRAAAARAPQPEDNLTANCLPPGMPGIMGQPYPMEFLLTPGKVTIVIEAYTQVRHIYTDGRPLPEEPEPKFFGTSIGRWEGDTLVIDTRHFTDLDKHWVDQGIPASKDFRMIERYRLINNGNTLEGEWTLIDPQNWEGEWKGTRRWNRVNDHDIQEVVCLPDLNEHLQSTSSGVHIRQ